MCVCVCVCMCVCEHVSQEIVYVPESLCLSYPILKKKKTKF